jgi:hypothetical protein
MKTQSSLNLVTHTLVPEEQRMEVVDRLFGLRFPLELEPYIFGITDRMAASYDGGLWIFHQLSNGGFYMSPDDNCTYHVVCDNFYQGDLSADALGIVACSTAYSHLSFSGGAFSHTYADHYHRLREFMFEHQEVRNIIQATD